MILDPPANYVIDSLGREVRAGDYIVYGSGRGDISFGEVTAVNSKPGKRWDHNHKLYIDNWDYSLRIKTADNYSWSRGSATLWKLGNIVLMDGASAALVKQKIEDAEKTRLEQP